MHGHFADHRGEIYVRVQMPDDGCPPDVRRLGRGDKVLLLGTGREVRRDGTLLQDFVFGWGVESDVQTVLSLF